MARVHGVLNHNMDCVGSVSVVQLLSQLNSPKLMVCWFRVNETSRLQRKHLDMNPPPPPGTKDEEHWHKHFSGRSLVVGFRDRKGWRRRTLKGQHQVYGTAPRKLSNLMLT
jgi:hypothetical protein